MPSPSASQRLRRWYWRSAPMAGGGAYTGGGADTGAGCEYTGAPTWLPMVTDHWTSSRPCALAAPAARAPPRASATITNFLVLMNQLLCVDGPCRVGSREAAYPQRHPAPGVHRGVSRLRKAA